MKNLVFGLVAVVATLAFYNSKANADYTMTCSSEGYRYATCYVNNATSVEMVRQLSYPTSQGGVCVYGQTWGFNAPNIVWVDHGCRAEFRVREYYVPPQPLQITCSSEGYRYNSCSIMVGRGSVRLVEQLSYPTSQGGMCVYGQTWGYDQTRIWVDHGCRAVFQVYPRGGIR